MARAPEEAIEAFPVDQAAHVRAGGGHGNDRAIRWIAALSVVANQVAHDPTRAKRHWLLTQLVEGLHQVLGGRDIIWDQGHPGGMGSGHCRQFLLFQGVINARPH